MCDKVVITKEVFFLLKKKFLVLLWQRLRYTFFFPSLSNSVSCWLKVPLLFPLRVLLVCWRGGRSSFLFFSSLYKKPHIFFALLLFLLLLMLIMQVVRTDGRDIGNCSHCYCFCFCFHYFGKKMLKPPLYITLSNDFGYIMTIIISSSSICLFVYDDDAGMAKKSAINWTRSCSLPHNWQRGERRGVERGKTKTADHKPRLLRLPIFPFSFLRMEFSSSSFFYPRVLIKYNIAVYAKPFPTTLFDW